MKICGPCLTAEWCSIFFTQNDLSALVSVYCIHKCLCICARLVTMKYWPSVGYKLGIIQWVIADWQKNTGRYSVCNMLRITTWIYFKFGHLDIGYSLFKVAFWILRLYTKSVIYFIFKSQLLTFEKNT
jgi:hypothetical protein